MNDNQSKERDDFQSFSKANSHTTSNHLDQKVLKLIEADLCPTHKVVFFKLVMTQAFIGLITLLFCPQFGISLTNNHKVFHFFHHTFGATVCMALCGCLFIGAGSAFAAHILKKSEIKIILNSKGLYHMAISIAALLIFLMLGAPIYLSISITWLVGAVLGGITFFYLSFKIKEYSQD